MPAQQRQSLPFDSSSIIAIRQAVARAIVAFASILMNLDLDQTSPPDWRYLCFHKDAPAALRRAAQPRYEPRSRGLRRNSGVSIIIAYLYLAVLAAIFAGIASFIHASFQPTRLHNPGMTAYRVPAALALRPPPPLDASPEPELAADADPPPVLSPTAASGQQVQRLESPKGPAPKKSKQTASRPHALHYKYFMTDTQFHSYGYFRPR